MKKVSICFVLIVTVALLAGGIDAVVRGDREFSANENRYLSQFPTITWSGILSGEVQEDITDAFNDQFMNRDFWTGMTTSVEKLLGFQDIGGVYLGEEHYYFEKVMNQDISQTNYFQNLRFVDYLAVQAGEAQVTALLVPSPGIILRDKLPEKATLYDADRMYQEAAEFFQGRDERVKLLDLRQTLEETARDKQVYYRTDHHWSLRGAYVGYEEYIKSMGRQPDSYESFDIQAISDSFYGTLYSKVLDRQAVADELDAPKRLPEVTVNCDGQERTSIYEETKKEEKDKYAYFFGGNYGEVRIQNPQGEERRLLVIKDSFANSMAPFLLQDYSEICMLDLRYYKTSIREFVEEYGPDEVLVLYEMSNFATDENLNRLTK